jgi:hypothetical protein
MADNNSSDKNDSRGLASADDRTRELVAKAGSEIHHEKRGAHGTDKKNQGQNKQDNK